MTTAAMMRVSMPPASRSHHETRLGQLLSAALDAKAEEQRRIGIGRTTYTYRDLGDDAGISFTYIGKIIHGKSRPSREIVLAIVKALAPYLPADETLMAAGYMPQSTRLRSLLRQLARYPTDALEGVDRSLRRIYFKTDAAVDFDEQLYRFAEEENASERQHGSGQQ